MGYVTNPLVKLLGIIFLLPSSVSSINKCCGENQYFDKDLNCVVYPTVNDTKQEESLRLYYGLESHNFVTNISTFPCGPNKYQVQKFERYQVMENGSLLLTEKSVLFSENSYCLEMYDHGGSGLVRAVYSCPCIDHMCVWKCCVPGMELSTIKDTIDGTPTIKCIDTIDTNTTIWNIDQLNATDVPSFYVLRYSLQTCKNNGVDNFLLKIKSHHVYSLQENGSILTEHYGLIAKDNYCGDFETNENSSERVLIACVRESEVENKYIFYAVLNAIGSFFLLVTIGLHIWLPELAGLHGKCLICHASCLLVAHICNTINQTGISYPSPNFECCFLAYLMQFSYMTSFFWLNVICVDMSLTFSSVRQTSKSDHSRKHKKRFFLYSFYSWGSGVLMTCFTLIMEYAVGFPAGHAYKPNIGTASCWFFSNNAVALYFYGPMTVLLVVNLGLFIYTVRKIVVISRGTKILQQSGNGKSNSGVENKRFIIYLKIFSLMGVSWLMEVISWLIAGPDELWFLTDAINSLRGFFIFIVFCWKPKVYKGIHNKLPWLHLLKENNKTPHSTGNETRGNVSDSSTLTTETTDSQTPRDEYEMKHR